MVVREPRQCPGVTKMIAARSPSDYRGGGGGVAPGRWQLCGVVFTAIRATFSLILVMIIVVVRWKGAGGGGGCQCP